MNVLRNKLSILGLTPCISSIVSIIYGCSHQKRSVIIRRFILWTASPALSDNVCLAEGGGCAVSQGGGSWAERGRYVPRADSGGFENGTIAISTAPPPHNWEHSPPDEAFSISSFIDVQTF